VADLVACGLHLHQTWYRQRSTDDGSVVPDPVTGTPVPVGRAARVGPGPSGV